MERTTCVDPEAAAFVFTPPPPQDIALAPDTSPTPPQNADFPFAMASMFNCEHCPFSFDLLSLVSYQEPQQVLELLQVVVANSFNWPPTAQVYAPEAPPTLTDIYEADADVLEPMNELPAPPLCTLAKLGNTHELRATSVFGLETAGLKGDERALTPGQEDGSCYGIRFRGLAYGDEWELPKVGKHEGMFVRRPSQRPSGSQRSDTEALFVREDSEVRGEDSDDSGQDDEADPCPEVNADAEDLAAASEGAATKALAAVDSSINGFSEEEHKVVATVRYRASYGDIEKNPIHSAADTFAEYKVDRLSMQCIW
ncbi:hypothetical protein N0V91_009867 [Didymella pomorum]|uniref:Uncharacterized protein n=1 Tax=Didymella pomorum TaxID=749634 RepID=A0A9W9D318_9PLEO|nr:hypothetical protein N0V91_009867 [Didymella pomorum]